MTVDLAHLLVKAEAILAKPSSRSARLRALCYLLRHNVAHYTWVGLYLAHPSRAAGLDLGPWEGEAAEARQEATDGPSAKAASSGKPVIAVLEPEKGAEIAIPVTVGGVLVATMEIHSRRHFAREEQIFLVRVCDVVAARRRRAEPASSVVMRRNERERVLAQRPRAGPPPGPTGVPSNRFASRFFRQSRGSKICPFIPM